MYPSHSTVGAMLWVKSRVLTVLTVTRSSLSSQLINVKVCLKTPLFKVSGVEEYFPIIYRFSSAFSQTDRKKVCKLGYDNVQIHFFLSFSVCYMAFALSKPSFFLFFFIAKLKYDPSRKVFIFKLDFTKIQISDRPHKLGFDLAPWIYVFTTSNLAFLKCIPLKENAYGSRERTTKT